MMDYKLRCEILEREIVSLQTTIISLAVTLVEIQNDNKQLSQRIDEIAREKGLQAVPPYDQTS